MKLMQAAKSKRSTKTFPLEIENELHKTLKVMAIKEDKTLHSLIIDTLSACIQEEPGIYRGKTSACKVK
ncbi:MAG: hypothetical protein WCS65_11450 [Verrucomicrobiae bacterium]